MEFLALVGAVLVLLASPGPGPLALALVGSVQGWQRGLPFYFGIMSAVFIALLLVLAGAMLILERYAWASQALLVVSTGYMLWIAWRLAGVTGGALQENSEKSLGFFDGFAVNIANPKLYIGLTVVMTAFVPTTLNPDLSVFVTAAIAFSCILVTNAMWLLAGSALHSTLVKTGFIQVFRRVSAGLLVVFAIGTAYAFLASLYQAGQEKLMDWQDNIFEIASFIISIVTAFFLWLGFRNSVKSTEHSVRVEQANVYFEIGERWSKVLQTLYEVRNSEVPSLEELEAQYPTAKDFMKTDLWKKQYRPICNFFEDMGLIAHNKNLPVSTLQVLVTVSEADYQLMKPVLAYLRKHYRDDIYLFWNYLLESAKREPAIHPFKGRNQYEPG